MDIIYLCSIYHYLYTIIVAIICIPVFMKYGYVYGDYRYVSSSNGVFFTVIFFILFIGLRPINGYFVDMRAYDFLLSRYETGLFELDFDTDNYIFDNFIKWWGSHGLNHNLFFFIMACIYYGCAYVGIRKIFPDNVLAAYLVFVSAFSTFSYGTNGIKAGAAASIFIMALGYLDRKWICGFLMLVSLGFHHSMIVPIVGSVVVMLFKNPKYFYYGWLFCLIMATLHITFFQTLFAGFADEQGAEYLYAIPETTVAHIGFRPDFILYSAVPIWMGYKYEYKGEYPVSQTYSTLLHLYITANAVWLLCMYASFNNRIAYLSWLLYPIVIIYPFFDSENHDVFRYVKFKNAALYHLAFTCFMVFGYYGIFHLGR